MRIKLLSAHPLGGGTSFGKAFAYYAEAARAAGLDVDVLAVDAHKGARHGAYLLPLMDQMIRSFPSEDGALNHAFVADIGRRGVDVVQLHDDWPYDAPGLKGFYARRVTRFSQNHAKLLFANTRHTADAYLRWSGDDPGRVVVVGHPFPPIEPARATPGIDVLWVGTSSPKKRLDLLSRALSLQAWTGSAVAICHGTTNLPALERARIQLVSRFVSEEELDRLYRSARCFVLTGNREGFPMPPFEAYARGTPLVLPREPPSTEIYPESAAGIFYYTPGDAGELRATIERAIGAGRCSPDSRVVEPTAFLSVGQRMKAGYERLARR